MIHTLVVCQEVCVWSHLRNYGSVGKDFFLNVFSLLCKTEIHKLVKLVFLSTLTFNEPVIWAFSLFSSKWVAWFFNKSFSLSPGKCFVSVAAAAPEACFIAVKDFLSRQVDNLICGFANVIFNCRQRCLYVLWCTLVAHHWWILHALWVFSSKVIHIWDFQVFILSGSASVNWWSVCKADLKHLFNFGDCFICKEFIWSLSESVTLTIMDKDCWLVNDWHLRKTLFWIE